MPLENKKSLFNTKTSSEPSAVKNFSKFGSIYKHPNPVEEVERNASVVDNGSKSKINKTVPVNQLPKEVVIEKVDQIKEFVIEKVEQPKENVVDTTVKSASSGSRLTAKF